MSQIKTSPLTEEETERLCKFYKAHRDYGQRYIRTIPGGQVLASTFENFKDQFHQFQLRPDDIFVFGWPKNGSVWLAEMVWCLRNECNLEKAKQIDSFARFPFIDITFMADAFKHVLPVGHFSNFVAQVSVHIKITDVCFSLTKNFDPISPEQSRAGQFALVVQKL